MIQKHSTSKFATKLKFKIYKPNKNSQLFLCVSTNTDINKLNWRFNHIFLVITNQDFYFMCPLYKTRDSSTLKFRPGYNTDLDNAKYISLGARHNQGCFCRFANSRISKTSLVWKVIFFQIFAQTRLLNAP